MKMLGQTFLDFIRWAGPAYTLGTLFFMFIGVLAGVLWRTSSMRSKQLIKKGEELGHFCKDCRWAVIDPGRDLLGWGYARCSHESSRKSPEKILVTGTQTFDNMQYCESARGDYGNCGPIGKHWERKVI